jgi:cytochrome c oxidase cbb3-type subunit 4
MTIDVNDLRIAATVLSLLTFLGICAWATARRNRARFDAAAQLPLDDEAARLPLQDESTAP